MIILMKQQIFMLAREKISLMSLYLQKHIRIQTIKHKYK